MCRVEDRKLVGLGGKSSCFFAVVVSFFHVFLLLCLRLLFIDESIARMCCVSSDRAKRQGAQSERVRTQFCCCCCCCCCFRHSPRYRMHTLCSGRTARVTGPSAPSSPAPSTIASSNTTSVAVSVPQSPAVDMKNEVFCPARSPTSRPYIRCRCSVAT